MADTAIKTGHSLTIASVFEIEKQTSPNYSKPGNNTRRTYSTAITCAGADHDFLTEYEIQATGFSPAAYALKAKHLYLLRGRFFPTKNADTKDDVFLFEARRCLPVGMTEDFKDSLEDTVGVSGVGIVTKMYNIEEKSFQEDADGGNSTVVLMVKHSDFHPILKHAVEWGCEWRNRPLPHLSGTSKFVSVGKEVTIHGFIIDRNAKTGSYIMDVSSVSLTNGHETHVDKSTSTDGTVTASGRFKPSKRSVEDQLAAFELASFAKHIKSTGLTSPFKAPSIASTSEVKIVFPPSDMNPSSFLLASTLTESQVASKNKKKPGRPASKGTKRAQAPAQSDIAQPASQASGSRRGRRPRPPKSLDIDIDEE